MTELQPPELFTANAETLRQWASGFSWGDEVLLINIPQVPLHFIDADVARNRGYFAYPPHALLYLAAVLEEQGLKPDILDLNFLTLEAAQQGETDFESFCDRQIDARLEQMPHAWVGVSFMFEATRPAYIHICEHLKQRWPERCVLTGGVNATADSDELIRQGWVDMVFCNEGEQVLPVFLDFVMHGKDEIPPNIVYEDAQGTIRRGPLMNGGPVHMDIRSQYHRIPLDRYCKVGSLSNFSRVNGLDVPFSTVLAKRGCRARCAFCGVRQFNGKGVRLREVEAVVDEMEHVYQHFGIRHFDWLDDDLLFRPEESLALFHEIAERLPDITWAANNGLIATSITDDMFQAMADSGCIGFKVGLETGNPDMLKKVHKPCSIKRFLEFAQRAQKWPQVFVSVNFIIGLPEERFGQMLDSFHVAMRSKMHWHNYYIYQHLRNTEFYIAYGGMGDDEAELDHGKDSQGPRLEEATEKEMVSFNPARAGKFETGESDLLKGYDIFDFPAEQVPSREQLNEIWFTINTLTNFVFNPAHRSESKDLLEGMIRWLDVLAKAYPSDALMRSARYSLMCKAGRPEEVCAQEREQAQSLLDESSYWQERDAQFGFSAWLRGEQPQLPEVLSYLSDLPGQW